MAETETTDPRGVERLPPQVTFRCADCEEQPGDSEIGGYFTYEAADIGLALDEADFHVIDGAVVCDNCAYERDRRARTDQEEFYADRHAEGIGRERPGWRSRMYGRWRAKRRNRLAWLFADRQGRAILRQLREINRLPREETKR